MTAASAASTPKTVHLPLPRGGSAELGRAHPLFLLAGPCVVEGREKTLLIARILSEICGELGVQLVFKASYDKANRTSIGSFRGIGMREALDVLGEVKETFGVPIVTDVHEPPHVADAATVADIVQVPAFLCRQTSLLEACAASGRVVNVKKGQFLAPEDMRNVVRKLEHFGTTSILLTERGASFGYNNLVSDMRSLVIMAEHGYPIVFDGTHSVQRPGGLGDRSGGDREMVPYLVRAATAVGIDGLFLECHDDPDNALSDGPNNLDLRTVPALLTQVLAIRNVIGQS
jgi:2-dehydro-3-deoxyphosphooctonate aldolase (KDO 8-P synthase)